MASFIDVTNLTYCGKEAQDIFSKEIYALDIASSGIRMVDNVKGKVKLYSGEIGDVWQLYTCPFTPSGQVVLDESVMEPVEIKINLEECYDKFWNTFLVEQTQINLNGGIPQTFFDWFFNDKLTKKMAKEYQEIFWKGDTAYTGPKTYLTVIDGIEKKLEASANLIDGAVFTVDNIIAQVEAAVMGANTLAISEEVDTETYSIFMNRNDVRLLKVALGKDCGCNLSNSVFNNYGLEGDTIYVMGFKVVATEQSSNTIIVGPANNMVLGYDTFSASTEYKLINMKETTGDNQFRVIALTNIAVGLVLGGLFTYSRPI